MANEGTKPTTAQGLEALVGLGAVDKHVTALSGSTVRTPTDAALMLVGRELTMIRVALAERNALLAESNEMARAANASLLDPTSFFVERSADDESSANPCERRGPDGKWSCTRPVGHDGPHVATSDAARFCAAWSAQ